MDTWISFLIRCDSEPQWSDGVPWNWITAKDPLHYLMAERPAYDIDESPMPAAILDNSVVQAAGGYQIGAWDIYTGEQFGLVDEVAYEAIRPLGNSPEQTIYDPETGDPIDIVPPGLATPLLRYQQFAGSSQAHIGDDAAVGVAALYPQDNQPFPGHMLRMHWPEIAHSNKYGWQFELDQTYDDTHRNPSSVFISVFGDADCTQFLYQVGAMYRGLSDFQVDDEGNPVEVWLQNNFGTQNTLEPTDIHFAICNGHYTYHEGRATMTEQEVKEEDLFWKDNQPNQGTLRALGNAWERGSGQHPSGKEYLNHGQQVAIHQHLLKLGFDRDELNICDMFNGGLITAKEAALRLLQCIAIGAVKAP